MAEKKKIPCRVCGKLFVPCAYCQEHADVFRWRNFACSRECATKYINDTIGYRESLKNKETETVKEVEHIVSATENVSVAKSTTTRKKTTKKTSTDIIENTVETENENKETE